MNFRNESVGAISTFKAHNNIIAGKAGKYQFKLTPYNHNIVRVQVSKYDAFDEYPFSVIMEPETVITGLHETSEEIVLKTDQLEMKVTKSPFRLSFFNKAGDLLNADDPTFGISWLGEEVTNYKRIAQDEVFLGMGEKSGGLNRRGSSYDNWNSDAFGFNNDTDPLYVSTPFFIGCFRMFVP